MLLHAADGPAAGCGTVNALVDDHIAHVNARIEELQQLKTQLIALRHRCAAEQPVEDCGIMQGLISMETGHPRARPTHVG